MAIEIVAISSASHADGNADNHCPNYDVEDHSSNVQTTSHPSTAPCTLKVTSGGSIFGLQGERVRREEEERRGG